VTKVKEGNCARASKLPGATRSTRSFCSTAGFEGSLKKLFPENLRFGTSAFFTFPLVNECDGVLSSSAYVSFGNAIYDCLFAAAEV